MLLDTASLYFRAFYGVPDSVTAPDGTPVNAIRGFLDMVATLVTRYSPTSMVACLDNDWRPAWRVELLPSYKGHRVVTGTEFVEVVPDLLSPQVPILIEVLTAIGIATAGVDGYEADDVIGTFTEQSDQPVAVVTGDRDLFQLIDDKRGIRVLYTGRGVAKLEVIDEAEVVRRYGVQARQYADFAVLRGDPSDGLPGVAGIGDKTAAGLMNSFGDLESLLDAVATDAPAMAPAAHRKLLAAADYLAVAPTVVRVARDADVPTVDSALPRAPRHPDMLDALAERWGLTSPVRRLLTALGQ